MEDPQAQTEPGEASVVKPVLIGWKEYVDFPEWKIRHMKVKIDTGARTSALDVPSYDLNETPAGLIVELRLVPRRKAPTRSRRIVAPVVRMAQVCNSNGMRERRPVIEAILRLGPISKRVELTLTNRSSMLFRMILGRKALENDFVVDVSKKYLLSP
jgi:hypothetical protein